jgi:hypothetical protein
MDGGDDTDALFGDAGENTLTGGNGGDNLDGGIDNDSGEYPMAVSAHEGSLPLRSRCGD